MQDKSAEVVSLVMGIKRLMPRIGTRKLYYLLEKHHIQVSMTESYDPYANAVAERINATIKQEVLLKELECDLGTQQRIVAQSVAIYNEL